MTKNLFKDTLRRVWKTRGRFFAILAIIAIGCGFFAGVKVTSPDIKKTADKYYKDNNLMDIRIVSTFGFSADEVDRLALIDGVSGASGGYSADMFIKSESGENPVTRVYSLSPSRSDISPAYINHITLEEGRFPTSPNECLIETKTPDEYKVGGTITLSAADKENSTSDILKYDTFNIVGRVSWVRYVDFERGTTTIGSGKIGSYIIIPEENFVSDYYTEVCLTLDGADKLDSFSEEYSEFVESKKTELEAMSDTFHNQRIEETETELADAHTEIENARAEFESSQSEYERSLAAYNSAIDEAKSAFDDTRAEIAEKEEELAAGREKYKSGLESYANSAAAIGESKRVAENKTSQYSYAKSEAEQTRQIKNTLEAFLAADWSEPGVQSAVRGAYKVNTPDADGEPVTEPPVTGSTEPASTGIVQTETSVTTAVTVTSASQTTTAVSTTVTAAPPTQLDTYISIIGQLDTAQLSVSETAKKYASLPVESPERESCRIVLEGVLSDLNVKLADADYQLSVAESEINRVNSQLAVSQNQLNASYTKLTEQKAALDEAEAELKKAKSELAAADLQIENSNPEARRQLEETKSKLDSAQTELEENEKKLADREEFFLSNKESIKWYMLDRNDNQGYSSFGEDADRVDSIARIFPVFFILVAALVCFNTMTRMVDEQRTEIGTLKALGCGNAEIISQFLLYAAAASIIGALIGLSVGFQLFPRVIFNTYEMMYDYPDVICEFRWDYALGCIAASLLCTSLSVVSACSGAMRGQPAQLMRPKPPKSGKRVLLERIPLIWNRLSFKVKITVRNVLRYKNRVLMTVIGIGGCTALMLAGFGLRYAISAIVDLQFGEIMKYDAVCTFSASDEEYSVLYEDISSNSGISDSLFAMQKSITAKSDKRSIETYRVVPEAPDKFGDFITLRDRESSKSYTLSDDGVIINEKLAQLLGVGAGDELSFADTDKTVKIAAVTENYSQNYVYFTPELYNEVFGDYEFNIFWLMKSDSADSDTLSEQILENSCIMSVNFMDTAGDTFRKMIKNLNAIVYLIIASSGALALVVLYNLSNISITERMRELATIKVLGFRDGELAAYIYRENTVSAVIGMILGLIAGIFLTEFVVRTAEVDVVMFCHDIPPHCFVFAALLTALFTVSVNAALYFRMKKIDMAGSMKAIE